MGKIRVYTLAKELEVDPKLLLPVLAALGVKVTSHAATIEEEMAEKVRMVVAQAQQVQAQRKAAEPAAAEAPAKPKPRRKPRPAAEPAATDVAVAAPPEPGRARRREPEPARVVEVEEEEELIEEELPEEELALVQEDEEEIEEEPEQTEEERFAEITARLRLPQGDRSPSAIDVPPVVTVMGHVDHGKTTLLDAIRDSNVTDTESGGITQHIGASEVETDGKRIVFLDTPGHRAFTAMRARGAQVTDIAVLVVAADDGVMPQTQEAIDHARNAGVPIIIAINKMDLASANVDRVKQELAERDLVPEDWGGQTICVPMSALTGEGMDELLEMILLVAEVGDLWADPEADFVGVVVEARLDTARGPLATILVRNGTLGAGDAIVTGTAAGKVRRMIDPHGNTVKTAQPGTAVEVVGLSEVPAAGELVEKSKNVREARTLADERTLTTKKRRSPRASQVALEQLLGQIEAGDVEELNIIIKGDVSGSVEALRQALIGLNEHYEGVEVVVVHTGVGEISETDVLLALASNAIVVGFHVSATGAARREADQSGVQLRYYDIIYQAVDDVSAAMAGLLPPDLIERDLGQAEVRATFRASRVGVIAGCLITEGLMRRGASLRVLRDGEEVFAGRLNSLRHVQEDRQEIEAGLECGIAVDGFNDWQEGDIIQAFVIEERRAVPVSMDAVPG